jgi:chromosome segregation ATPase
MSTTIESRLNELRQTREDRKVGGYDRYMQLVADTADGVEHDPNDAAEVLDDFGVDCERLEVDVQTLLQRRGWAQVLADGPMHDEQLAKHQGEIEQLVFQRDKFLHDIEAKIHDAVVARDAHAYSVGGRAHARMDLASTAWPHIKEKVADLRGELRLKGEAIPGLVEFIRGLEGGRHASEQTLAAAKAGKTAITKETVKRHQVQLAHMTKELATATQRLAELQAVVNEVADRLGAAEQEMLEP